MKNPALRFSALPLAIFLFAFPHAALAQMEQAGDVTAVSEPVPLSPVLTPANGPSPNNLMDFLSRCAAVAAVHGGPVPVLVDSSGKLFCGAVTAAAPIPVTPAIAAVPVAMPTGPCAASSGAKGNYNAYGECILPLCPPQLAVKCGSGYHMVPGNGANADGCPQAAQCIADSGPCTTSGGAKGVYNGLGVCAPDICPSFALECSAGHHAEVNGGTGSDGCPIPPQCVKDASR